MSSNTKMTDNTKFFQKEYKSFGMKVLKAQGAFIRTAARSSIKKSKKASKPGNPPKSHANDILRKLILFQADSVRQTVTVGPAISRGRSTTGTGKTVPEVLEYGGYTVKRYKRRYGKRNIRRIKISARPYMRPAFTNGLSDLRRKWETIK